MMNQMFKTALFRFALKCALSVSVLVLTACQSLSNHEAALVEEITHPQLKTSDVSQNISKRTPKLALVLGGGAARGFAHVGVIQVLEEAGIKPDLVVGTSAGSVVASLYASGKSAEQLKSISSSMDESSITDWKIPIGGRGMLQGDALQRYISTQVGAKKIEEMKIPLGIVATDLKTGQAVLFQRGDVATAVRASSAVPAVFEPVRIGNREFVDGGLVSPVPVRFARQMGADIVLAVDISSIPEGNSTDGILKVLLQTTAIMTRSINEFELKDADVVIRPDLAGVGSANFAARQKSIEAGRFAMQQSLSKLKVMLQPR
jgi:NTE family protein